MSERETVILAENVSKRFPDPSGKTFDAVSGVTLSVPAHGVTALVGADGAGKTTFLRMVTGLMAPDAGKLSVLGLDSVKDASEIQNRISYMPQKFGLYEDLSVQENMDLFADLHGVPQEKRKERYRELLAMADLGRFTARPAGKLSGGMKQKLGLICTLVRSPDLLLLDEPSVGVDPLSRRELGHIIRECVERENLSVLWSTSYMDEAEQADYVLMMHEGRLLDEGRPAELIARTESLAFRAVPAPGEPARFLQAKLYDESDLVLDAVPEGGEVRFICRDENAAAVLQKKFPDVRMYRREPDFEDCFMTRLKSESGKSEEYSEIKEIDAESSGNTENAASAAESSEDGPIIQVKDLVRKFGDFTAVASTTFDVHRGEIFGLLGPNGAGKTTTFRMLCGLLPASSGFIQVAGYNLRHARAEARGSIGYVAQKFSLYGNLTIAENLEFFGGAYGISFRHLDKRIKELTAQFDLDPEMEAGAAPMGYKRRLAMAAALIHEPRVLFLDEPTSGIDPLARREFWRTITDLARKGVTVIVTTHFMEEAEYCDRIAIQDAGKFLAFGTPSEVRGFGNSGAKNMNEAFIAIVEAGRREAAS